MTIATKKKATRRPSARAAKKVAERQASGKRRAKKKKTPAPKVSRETDTRIEFGPIVEIPLSDLVRHPKNRIPTPEQVAERAESMARRGQDEPIRVHLLGNGKYEILSGETRFRAARKLRWKNIDARVAVDVTPEDALKVLAEANGSRSDLNPIQKAELINALCEPIDDGGAGLTHEQAGERMGLSRSGAANLVRLLRLPESVRELITAGTLPESYARETVRYFDEAFPEVIHQVAAEVIDKELGNVQHESRDEWIDTIAWGIGHDARIIKVERAQSYHLAGHYLDRARETNSATFFKLTKARREAIGAVDIGDDVIATNIEAWKELNAEAAEELKKKGAHERSRPAAEKPASKPAGELTAAEKRAKKQAAAKRLGDKIEKWRHRWLCELVARDIDSHQTTLSRFTAWLLIDGPAHSFNNRDLQRPAAKFLSQRAPDWKTSAEKIWKWFDGLDAVKTSLTVIELARHVLRLENSPIPAKVIESLAAQIGVDLAAEWLALDHTEGGRRWEFLNLHTTAQLDELRAKSYPREVVDFDASSKRTEKVAALLPISHTLPKSIKEVAKK